jgi:hypothetical protein
LRQLSAEPYGRVKIADRSVKFTAVKMDWVAAIIGARTAFQRSQLRHPARLARLARLVTAGASMMPARLSALVAGFGR